MLALFETPAGYALFKIKGEEALKADLESLNTNFDKDPNKYASLKDFCKFSCTTTALESAADVAEGKLPADLEAFLRESILEKPKYAKEVLCVAEPKLAAVINKVLGISCSSPTDAFVHELMRSLRSNVSLLLSGVKEEDLKSMILGLSHSMARHKIKFSPNDRLDAMIVQAIGLLDDLDKELNAYGMRLKEWYGWHFPELAKIIPDNRTYARLVEAVGMRPEADSFNNSSGDFETNLKDLLRPILNGDDALAGEVLTAMRLSMGTEITPSDLLNIRALAEQVTALAEYRAELDAYLRSRMQSVAPNLTAMVGELVGARLIAHAGSLMALAKHPASTIQILGAEKALFRALKTKGPTPKYGILFHASLVGQAGGSSSANPASAKIRGKISRVLAAKTALAIRCDALGEVPDGSVGRANRLKVENRLAQLEAQARNHGGGGKMRGFVKSAKGVKTNGGHQGKYDFSAKNTPNNNGVSGH